MRRTRILIVFILAFYLIAAAGVSGLQAAPDSYRLCPASSDAVLYFDARAFRNFVEKNGMAAQFKEQADKIKAAASVDIFKDINSFTAVLTGIASYKMGKNPQGAFLFEGFFRADEVAGKLAGAGIKSEAADGVKMFKLDEDVYLAMPSEKYLIYGNISEIKAICSLIASKEKNDISTVDFFKKEIASGDAASGNLILTVRLPKELSELATAIAKVNKEQAVFANLEGFVGSASGAELLFKYVYLTADDAAKGAVNAKEFMDKGFQQIAYNAKKMTEGAADPAKVAVERFNFVKSGLMLMLKLQQTMKIEPKEKSVYIKFSLAQAEKETADFARTAFDAFIATLVKPETKPAAAPTGN